MFISC